VAAVISVTALAAWLFPIGNLPSSEQPPTAAGEKGEPVATG
jgi:hypothetical protein